MNSLSFFLKIGWRNILRHRRRSLVTLLSVSSGVIAVILFAGFIEANYQGLRESVIRSQYGHLQIYKAGYEQNHRQSPDKYRLTPDEVAKVRIILESSPRHVVSSRRLEFTGLLGNDRLTEAAVVRGVDPDAESLINSAMTVIAGKELDAANPDGVLLGEGLARAVNAKVGDQLTFVTSTVNGVMNAVDVRVEGIFRSFAKEYDDRAMLMGMDQSQKALNTMGVDMVVLLIDDTPALPAVVKAASDQFIASGLQVEVKEWFKLATFYQKVVDLYNGFFSFIVIVIAIVILFGVTNTMLISVMERTSEIGTLRALGTKARAIVHQFTVEALLLSFVSALVGIALAVLIAHGITAAEIMMPPPPGSSRGYPLRIATVPLAWLMALVSVLFIALAAAWYPARNASRKSIVDALRHV
jgi:putative ABC transport system permease protein